MYILKSLDAHVILYMYVDNFLCGTSLDVINNTQSFLSSNFDIKYLGENN